MSVQIKGVGTIGGIDQGLNTVGVVTATSFVGTGVSVVGVITATSFVGSGANLTGISGVSIANQSDNRLITCTGTTDSLNAEQYLTYSSQSSLNNTDGNGTSLLGGNYLNLKRTTGNANYINAPLANAELLISADESIIFKTVHTADFNSTERFRITSAGVFQASGTTLMKQHSVGVGTTNSAGRNAGVSTSTGELIFNTSTNNLNYYMGNALGWATVKRQTNDGSSPTFAARSAKALLDDGITANGVYWLNMHGAYTQANSKRHYCLMDTSYDGGGWTLLTSHNHGNDFISGTNYHFSHDVGSNPTSVNDFIASNFGYDRRNTFTPAANDEFLVRRSDNNDWRRFVVSAWSPTSNSVSNGWETTNKNDGSNTGHPYWASGTVYGTGGSAESTSYAWHFNGCALGGNCANGGDSAAFSDYSEWAWSTSTYKAYGSAHRGNPGANLSWGNSALTEGSSLYIHIFYRKAGTQ